MLYDKRWDYKVKADPFTLENLIAWLETMPADGRYDYTRPFECMVAQYLKTACIEEVGLDSDELDDRLPGLNRIAQGFYQFSRDGDWTFGAALDRARKLAKTS